MLLIAKRDQSVGSTGAASAAPVPAITVDAVSHHYGDLWAVDDVSLQVPAGATAGLIGPNGSGKSTTLRLLTGLLPLQFGHVSVFGEDLQANPVGCKRRLAFVPDLPRGFDHLSIREYLELYAALHRLGADYFERARAQLEALRLRSAEHRLLGALSMGTRRKVSLVAAASSFRPLLIVDEATSALDPEAVMVLESVLRFGARHGRTALIATQDLNFAERACDLVYLLAAGTIVAKGSPAELCRQYQVATLREVFMKATRLTDALEKLDDDLAASLAG